MFSRYNLATVNVLLQRDLKRFLRQGSRLAGALMQPLLFWLILGSGFAKTFQMQGNTSLNYMQYFYPGVISMMVLFSALFSTMSIIEDRNSGFLQAVLTGPSSRGAMVLGKILGGTVVCLIQVALFLLLCPWAGFAYSAVSWVPLFCMLFATAFALNAFGFFLAWALNSIQGYHAIMMVILMPLWMISGAFFPMHGTTTWLKVLMIANPMAYSVEGIRAAFYQGALPQGLGQMHNSFALQMTVVVAVALVSFQLAAWTCKKSHV